MKIGGIIKNSLIDYPGNISTVIFTTGCNLNCNYCHNHKLINEDDMSNYDNKFILNFIKERHNFIDGVCITGGEPTLQNDLISFVEKINEMNLKVKLDTNGSNPDIVEKLIEKKLIDYIAVDIKCSKKKARILGIKNIDNYYLNLEKTINIIQNSNIEKEYRTTILQNIHNELEMIRIISLIPDGKDVFYYLQKFRKKGSRGLQSLPNENTSDVYLQYIKETIDKFLENTKVKIRN